MNNAKKTRFRTLADAQAAGWVRPRRLRLPADYNWSDVSGPNSYGYAFSVYRRDDAAGACQDWRADIKSGAIQSVSSRTITLTDELNAANKPGAFLEMFDGEVVARFTGAAKAAKAAA